MRLGETGPVPTARASVHRRTLFNTNLKCAATWRARAGGRAVAVSATNVTHRQRANALEQQHRQQRACELHNTGSIVQPIATSRVGVAAAAARWRTVEWFSRRSQNVSKSIYARAVTPSRTARVATRYRVIVLVEEHGVKDLRSARTTRSQCVADQRYEQRAGDTLA
jgi:hypothetical protein